MRTVAVGSAVPLFPKRVAFTVLAAFLVAACASPPPTPVTDAFPPVASVRFVALGDAGTGEAMQQAVADAIASVCAREGCDFAVALGDNLYDHGASGPYDPQFETKFERPYANLSMPFHMVLGNHDNSGAPGGADPGFGLWYESGNHEVSYAKRTDRMSDKWRMPQRTYTVTDEAGLVGLFVLDTNTLVHNDVPVPPRPDLAFQEQAQWIRGELQGSKAVWKLVLGHHPYMSNGPHGDAGSYDGNPDVVLGGGYLKSLYEAEVCGQAHAILAGHDHNLQWLQETVSCPGTQLVVSGGGGAHTYPLPGEHPALFQAETNGFWWFEATPTRLLGVAYGADGGELFRHEVAAAK